MKKEGNVGRVETPFRVRWKMRSEQGSGREAQNGAYKQTQSPLSWSLLLTTRSVKRQEGEAKGGLKGQSPDSTREFPSSQDHFPNMLKILPFNRSSSAVDRRLVVRRGWFFNLSSSIGIIKANAARNQTPFAVRVHPKTSNQYGLP